MLSSFRLISHPAEKGRHPPKLLKDHLDEVGSISKAAVETLSLENFPLRDDISHLVYLIGTCHDFGKATSFFQRYIEDPDNSDRSEKRFHSQLSSLFGYYVVSKIMKDEDLAYIAYYVIYYHHGDLGELLTNYDVLSNKYWGLVQQQSNDILRFSQMELQVIYDNLLGSGNVSVHDFLSSDTLSALRDRVKKQTDRFIYNPSTTMDHYFEFLFAYSVLLYSDKLSASGIGYDKIAGEKKRQSPVSASIIDEYVSRLSSIAGDGSSNTLEINALRNEAYREAMNSLKSLDLSKDRFLLIELPTGLGKTMISVGTALRLRESIMNEFGYRPRMIYSLPFLSIIDDNFDKITDAFLPVTGGVKVPASILLKHHHLAEVYFSFSDNGRSPDIESYAYRDMERQYLLMEGWNSEFIVTSFIQLFHSIITNRNSSAMKFLNITNSIIIIDEVQAIHSGHLNLIREVLKYIAEKLNSWIIFMTATMPAFLEPGDAKNLVPDPQKYFGAMNRVLYRRTEGSLTLKELANEVLSITGRNIIVVMNTIDSSRQLYLLLRSRLERDRGKPITVEGYADFEGIRLIYLSSAVTPRQRKDRLKLIKQKHGDGGELYIVITTQLVEAGVDIDLDVVVRDRAPLDSIVQAGGRANRNGAQSLGEVRLVRLVDEKGNEYATKIYDPVLLNITDEMLDEMFRNKNAISEDELHMFILEYYKRVRTKKINKISNDYLAYIGNLQFKDVHGFSLIEKTYEKADVFIPLNEEARKTWKEYESIKKIPDPIKRHEEMLNIRNRFYDYVVSINKKFIGDANEPVVNATEFSIEWDDETGVKGKGNDLIW